MVQNHLLSQCHKIERWVYGCNNMSSATRYDKGFEVYVIYFGDDNKGYKITKYNRFIKLNCTIVSNKNVIRWHIERKNKLVLMNCQTFMISISYSEGK